VELDKGLYLSDTYSCRWGIWMECGGMSVDHHTDHFGYIITQKNVVIADVQNQKEFHIMQMELKIRGEFRDV